MTRVVFVTDIHGNRQAYGELLDHTAAVGARALVFGGDITPLPPRGEQDRVAPQRRFLVDFMGPAFRAFRARHPECEIYTMMGNDDWAANMDALEELEAQGVAKLLHMKAHAFVDGLSIAGYSCVPVTPFHMKDWDRFDSPGWRPKVPPRGCLWSTKDGLRMVDLDTDVRGRGTIQEDLARLATLSDPASTVYVAHTPPYRTKLDVLYDGTPIGSEALRAFLEEHSPPLSLHGHVHESPQMSGSMSDRVGRTFSVNPGASLHGLQAVVFDVADAERTLRPL